MSIHDAAGDGDVARLEELLDGNPELIHLTECWGRTPLHYAAIQGQSEAVRLLVARGAHIEARDRWGGTPFKLAIHEEILVEDRLPVIKALIDAHADVNARDDTGDTALHGATIMAPELVETLLGAGADVNAVDDRGETPLHDAVKYPGTEKVELLLAAPGIGVAAINKQGQTARDIAIGAGRFEFVTMIDEHQRQSGPA